MALLSLIPPSWRHARRALLGLAILGLMASAGVSASPLTPLAPEAREYQIKAVFLYNFAEFVEWPPEVFSSSQSPLIIGILGDDPFGRYIDEAVRDEKINNRPLEIRRFARIEDIGDCHILFISRSETGRLDRVLERLNGRSVLTVSDIDEFSRLGGMIRFVTEMSKVRLKINLRAAKQAHLTISSKLLRPAEIVSMRGL